MLITRKLLIAFCSCLLIANVSRAEHTVTCVLLEGTRIDVQSLSITGDRVTGTWEEETFNANGTVTGRASNGNLSVSISGGGLSGSMSVSFGSATQQVSINTSGTPLRGVSISLSRM